MLSYHIIIFHWFRGGIYMKQTNHIIKLVAAALMAALTFVVTKSVQIPIPFANIGYVHPGDSFVFLSGIILGPVYGGLAAGIGSMFADLLSPYAVYAFPTLIIKLLAAMVAFFAYRYIRIHSVLLSGALSAIIVALGYFICDTFFTGSYATAAIGVPFNLVQSIVGTIIAFLLLPLLKKVPQIRAMLEPDKTA